MRADIERQRQADAQHAEKLLAEMEREVLEARRERERKRNKNRAFQGARAFFGNGEEIAPRGD